MEKQTKSRRRVTKLAWPLIITLGALGSIRTLLHDLRLFQEFAGLIVVAIAVVWLTVVLLSGTKKPLPTLAAVGGVYGVCSAIIHIVMWGFVFGDNPPTVDETATIAVPEFVMQIFAGISTIITGLVAGTVLGIIAMAIQGVQEQNTRR